MGCWGATRECLRNCCGGPRSENYDAWLARERLRQLNHQTQRADQLNRQNVQLEMSLMQTQDILTSYRDLDMYEGAEPIDGMNSLTAAHIAQSAGNRGSNPTSRAPSLSQHSAGPRSQSFAPMAMDRRQASANLDLPSAPQTIRRDQLRSQSAARSRPAPVVQQLQRPSVAPVAAPQVTYEAPSPKRAGSRPSAPLGIAAVPEDAPLDRGALTAGKASPDPRAEPARPSMTPEARRATLAELKASVARLPNMQTSRQPAQAAGSPFGSPSVQPDPGHARTHGYRPS